MVPKLQLSRLGRSYLWAVIGSGLLVISHSIVQLYREPIGYEWFVIAGLTLISGSATVRLPSSYASISISETFVFTAVLLYGPAAGTLIVALDGLVISFWLAKRYSEPHRALFNMSAPALSVWCSANLFFLVARIPPLVERPAPINAIFPALILFAVAYFALNSWLITFIIALERHLSPIRIWRQSFLWWSMNYFCGASVAILFVGFNRTIDLGYIGLILPLMLVLYATFKSSMGRVEDANKHVEQMNRLYLSTIETLAMAIDAKDQVTHGHIRRVQAYATGLAREVGMRDDSLIKAIEAAALLHDMGKLAVPEYILNKPGKLSETEFEKMKLHASVGADILSAIDFPYPVVPIVRHHHENWDGTGYPDGLKGTDIPIGARILAVVDCFDALTSDRPYRPRLDDVEALRILIERRGSMYDPLVVDTFVRVYEAIAPEYLDSGPRSRVINEIASARQEARLPITAPVLQEITASSDEMLTLYEMASALGGQVDLAETGDIIANHLKRLIPLSLCVFYKFDSSTDEIVAKHAVGEGAALIRGTRIRLGQRLSGWVAANRQTICNSDPVLDLGDAARSHALNLRSCLSTPVLSGDELVGVLSLYSADANGFNDDHRRVIQVVARQICDILGRAREFEALGDRDAVTALPDLRHLEQIVGSQNKEEQVHGPKFTLLLIDVVGFNEINALHGSSVGDEVLRHVVRHATSVLRTADMLFRDGSDEFVALLREADVETANEIARRIAERMRANPLLIRTQAIVVDVDLTTVAAPAGGQTVNDLITAARTRSDHLRNDRSGSTVH